MDPSMQTSLAALRDIHLPDAVSIWPLAPGAWLLGGGLLLLIGAAVLIVRSRRRRQRPWSDAASEELASIEATFVAQRDAVSLAASLSSLLRRAVMARCPDDRVAALMGDDWVELLCRDLSVAEEGAARRRSASVVRELSETVYAGASTSARPEEWIAFVRSWIGANA
jgi:hypothetical protein